MKALELENIYYRQGDFLLNNISLEVEQGETLAIVGRSGCGKSTLIKAITNSVVLDSGIIRYFGKEMYQDEKNIRRNMSCMFDTTNFNIEMTGRRLAKEISRFEPDFSNEDFERYLSAMELKPNKRVRLYSTGLRKKFMLALLLARKPKLLVMDEMTTGLDEISRNTMWDLIKEYRQDNELTVIFSTHHLHDIDYMDARVITLEEGAIS